ncbi:hypothetical protein PC110_g5886 [Phytophthora cactorum]|uniref:Reverse transcriptase Ty1/copia-type domain-containing protein n=1 Tax=Phytophthora cactorum TaxID=29920 RepID=A0A329SLU6_9STRA|nr:hypothetical protein PC110_g5886 [Phytophthora cactorum]
MYLVTSTRADLAFPVGYLSRFVQRPNVAHAAALKRVLRYLAATQSQGVFFKNHGHGTVNKVVIDGYVDADWGNCPETRKSVSGYVMKMVGGPVAWAARRQSIVAFSTAEAEYAAACEACQESQSIKNVLMEIIGECDLEFNLGVDNQAAISLATHPTYSRKTRHIERRLHFVREMAQQKDVNLWKVSGEMNPADLLTKPMGVTRLSKMKSLIGIQPDTYQTHHEMKRQTYRTDAEMRSHQAARSE